VTAVVVAEGLAIVVLAVLVFNLLRAQARVLELLGDRKGAGGGVGGPRQGPALPTRPSRVGVAADPVRGTDPAGAAASIVPADTGVLVLAFITTSCSTCQELWGALAAGGAGRLPGAARLVVVVPGPGLESRRRVAELAPAGVDVVMSADAWAAYGVTGSPWAVVARDGRVVAEGPVQDWAGVVALAGPTG
jgi:hypothetical protein